MFFAMLFSGVAIAVTIMPFTQYILQETMDIELLDLPDEKIYTEIPTEFIISNTTSHSSRSNAAPKEDPKPEIKPEPTPDPKEVVTDDNIKEEPVPTPPTPNNNENINPAPPTPAPNPSNNNSSNNNGNSNGNSNNNGNDIWGNDNGDSKFSRKVLAHPEELKKLTKEKGTVVIRIAVNRDGKVVGTKYMKELSSIKHEKLGKAAAYYSKKYRFERDYKMPEVQYCNITLVFKLD
jgi:hypothetical protein